MKPGARLSMTRPARIGPPKPNEHARRLTPAPLPLSATDVDGPTPTPPRRRLPAAGVLALMPSFT